MTANVEYRPTLYLIQQIITYLHAHIPSMQCSPYHNPGPAWIYETLLPFQLGPFWNQISNLVNKVGGHFWMIEGAAPHSKQQLANLIRLTGAFSPLMWNITVCSTGLVMPVYTTWLKLLNWFPNKSVYCYFPGDLLHNYTELVAWNAAVRRCLSNIHFLNWNYIIKYSECLFPIRYSFLIVSDRYTSGRVERSGRCLRRPVHNIPSSILDYFVNEAVKSQHKGKHSNVGI